jgi:hypothetical protein
MYDFLSIYYEQTYCFCMEKEESFGKLLCIWAIPLLILAVSRCNPPVSGFNIKICIAIVVCSTRGEEAIIIPDVPPFPTSEQPLAFITKY